MTGRDIFISYSSKDEAIARLACERLEQTGYSCWFAPRDIPAGEFFAGQIIQALRESRFVLLFFSEHSNASAQVVREINFAVSQRSLLPQDRFRSRRARSHPAIGRMNCKK
jgi:TIR domain